MTDIEEEVLHNSALSETRDRPHSVISGSLKEPTVDFINDSEFQSPKFEDELVDRIQPMTGEVKGEGPNNFREESVADSEVEIDFNQAVGFGLNLVENNFDPLRIEESNKPQEEQHHESLKNCNQSNRKFSKSMVEPKEAFRYQDQPDLQFGCTPRKGEEEGENALRDLQVGEKETGRESNHAITTPRKEENQRLAEFKNQFMAQTSSQSFVVSAQKQKNNIIPNPHVGGRGTQRRQTGVGKPSTSQMSMKKGQSGMKMSCASSTYSGKRGSAQNENSDIESEHLKFNLEQTQQPTRKTITRIHTHRGHQRKTLLDGMQIQENDVKNEESPASTVGSRLHQNMVGAQKRHDEEDLDVEEGVGQVKIFGENDNQIKVVIRVRPFNEREIEDCNNWRCISVQNKGRKIVLNRGTDLKDFNFDFISNEKVPQSQIFNLIARPIADSCLQGYNGTIFAYGQTGAGKTFTIQGPSILCDSEGKEQDERGLLQRSFEYIFKRIQSEQTIVDQKGNGEAIRFLVKSSYLEIYNEQIVDMLAPSQVNLQVREDINNGVYVEGLQEEVVGNYSEMISLIQRGTRNRHVGATSMNRQSSRSHSVLTTIIESKSRSETGVWNVKQSRFHIIDLAGSERQKVAQTGGERLKEAGMINKSLSALGNVINSLVDKAEGKSRHVPYRDSKLTFILRDSLGGNSKTVIIANISPSSLNIGETLSTLHFAQRAKLIQNQAVINEDSTGTMILLKNEIKKLKKDLENFENQVCLLRQEKESLKISLEQAQKQIAEEEEEARQEDVILGFDELDQPISLDDKLEYSQQTSSAGRHDSSITFKALGYQSNHEKSQNDSIFQASFTKKETGGVTPQGPSSSNDDARISDNQKCPLNRSTRSVRSSNDFNMIPKKRNTQSQDKVAVLERLLQSRIFHLLEDNKHLDYLKDENRLQEKALEQYKAENEHLKLLVETQKTRLEMGETGDDDLKNQQFKVEIEYLKEIIKKQIDNEQLPLISQLQATIARLQSTNSSFKRLGSPVDDEIGYLDHLEDQVKAKTEIIDGLNDYFTNHCSLMAMQALQEKLKSLGELKEGMERETESLRQQIQEQRDQYDQLLEEHMNMDRSQQQLTSVISKITVERNEMEMRILELEREVGGLREEIEEREQIVNNEKIKENLKLELLIKDWNQQMQKKDQEKVELGITISHIQEENRQWQRQVFNLQNEIADKEVDEERYLMEMSDFEQKMMNLIEMDKEKMEQLKIRLREQEQRQRMEMEEIDKKIEISNKQKQEAEQQLIKQLSIANNQILELEERLQLSDQNYQTLNQQTSAKDQQIDQFIQDQVHSHQQIQSQIDFINKLQEERRQMQDERFEIQEDINRINADIQSKIQEVQYLMDQIRCMEDRHLQEIKRIEERYQDEIKSQEERQQNEIQRMDNRHQDEIKKIREELEQVQEQTDEVQKQLKLQTQLYQRLKDLNSKLEEDLVLSRIQVEDLCQKVVQMQKQQEIENTQNQEEIERMKKEMEIQLTRSNESNSSYNNQIQSLTQQLHNCNVSLGEMESKIEQMQMSEQIINGQMEDKQTYIKKIEQVTKQMKIDVDKKEMVIANLKDQVSKISKERDLYFQDLSALQDKYSTANEFIQSYQDKLSSLIATMETLEAKNTQLTRQISEETSIQDEIKNDYEQLLQNHLLIQAKEESMNKKIQQLESDKEQIEQVLRSEQQLVDQLNLQIEQLNSQISHLDAICKDTQNEFEAQLEKVKEEIGRSSEERWSEQMEEKDNVITQLTQKVDSLQFQLAQMEAGMVTKMDEIKEIKEINQILEEKLRELDQERKQMELGYLQKIENLVDQFNSKGDTQIRLLQSERDHFSILAQQFKQQLGDLTNKELEDKEEQIARVQMLEKQLEDERKRESEKEKDWIGKIEHEVEKNRIISEELNNYKKCLPEAETLLKEVNKRYQNSQKQIEQLLQENTKIKSQYLAQIQDLQSNIEKLKADQEQIKKQASESVTSIGASQEAEKALLQDRIKQLGVHIQNYKGQVQKIEEERQKYIEMVETLQDQLTSRDHQLGAIRSKVNDIEHSNKLLLADNKKCRQELEHMMLTQTAGYKIQLLNTTKKENNELREKNLSLQREIEQKNQLLQQWGVSHRRDPYFEEVVEQIIHLVSRTKQLEVVCKIIHSQAICMGNINLNQSDDAMVRRQTETAIQGLWKIIQEMSSQLVSYQNEVEMSFEQFSHRPPFGERYPTNPDISQQTTASRARRQPPQSQVLNLQRVGYFYDQEIEEAEEDQEGGDSHYGDTEIQTKMQKYVGQGSKEKLLDQTVNYLPTQIKQHSSLGPGGQMPTETNTLSTQRYEHKPPINYESFISASQIYDFSKVQSKFSSQAGRNNSQGSGSSQPFGKQNQTSGPMSKKNVVLEDDDAPLVLNSYSYIYQKHLRNNASAEKVGPPSLQQLSSKIDELRPGRGPLSVRNATKQPSLKLQNTSRSGYKQGK